MNRRGLLLLLGLLPVWLLSGCDPKVKKVAQPLPQEARVLALGDSLTKGLGATKVQSWPSQLTQITGWRVDNAGVNGDTSESALQRLPPLLEKNRYDAILIGVGGNDMLRQISPKETRANIVKLIRSAREHTTYVALIATPAPDPLRAVVGALKDAELYAQIAKEEKVLLIEDVYASVLSDSSLRHDQIHANARGYAQIAQKIADKLQEAGWRP